MQLFFDPTITETTTQVVFSKDESRHIVKVLRKQPGDSLEITNGSGYFFTAELVSTDPKRCMAQITAKRKIAPSSYSLHLAVAPTKLNDRYEWFMEKATEIGISEITPILCDHSERKVIKQERYEKILQSAMKQSLSAYLPKLNPMVSLAELISEAEAFSGQKCIAHCYERPRQSLQSVVPPASNILILIGPEGDFSEAEVSLALENGFTPISLGNRRLRTETAAIVACHSVAFLNE